MNVGVAVRSARRRGGEVSIGKDGVCEREGGMSVTGPLLSATTLGRPGHRGRAHLRVTKILLPPPPPLLSGIVPHRLVSSLVRPSSRSTEA